MGSVGLGTPAPLSAVQVDKEDVLIRAVAGPGLLEVTDTGAAHSCWRRAGWSAAGGREGHLLPAPGDRGGRLWPTPRHSWHTSPTRNPSLLLGPRELPLTPPQLSR